MNMNVSLSMSIGYGWGQGMIGMIMVTKKWYLVLDRIMGSYPYIAQVWLEANYEVFLLYDVCLDWLVAIIAILDMLTKGERFPCLWEVT